MRSFWRLPLSLVLTAGLIGCGSQRSSSASIFDPSMVGVNLGAKGNAEASLRFQAYLRKSGGCSATGNHPRVLISGFGLFEKTANISGLVVDNMRSKKFWPSDFKSSEETPVPQKLRESGAISQYQHGGKADNRTLSIHGKTYDFCFLLLDVQWDLAAAILVHEMERFQPQLVIMTGRGGYEASIEGGAINYAEWTNGYKSNGQGDRVNMPAPLTVDDVADHRILPKTDPGVQPVIEMTWDNQKLKQATQSFITSIGFSVVAPDARSENDYVCNNVSFVALHALKGIRLNLAGGEISLQPRITSNPQVGFFHFPGGSDLSAPSVFAWSQVIATLVTTALN